MRRPFLPILVVAMLAAGCAHVPAAGTYDWEASQLPGNDFAAFRLWVPDGVPSVTAVVSLVPGTDGDARGWVNDAAWRDFAQRHGMALFGCFLKGNAGGPCDHPEDWSGRVYLRALTECGTQAGHPELAGAPLILWGHSAGGQFNYNFACWNPRRVIAFVVNKGTYYDGFPQPETFQIPAIWFAGSRDSSDRLGSIADHFIIGRRRGAPWCLAMEPNAGHEAGHTEAMAILFVEGVLRTREKSQAIQSAWTGDLTTHRAAAGVNAAGRIASWLPDEPVARAWEDFVEGRPLPSPSPK